MKSVFFCVLGKPIKASNYYSEGCSLQSSAVNTGVHVCWRGECVTGTVAGISQDS